MSASEGARELRRLPAAADRSSASAAPPLALAGEDATTGPPGAPATLPPDAGFTVDGSVPVETAGAPLSRERFSCTTAERSESVDTRCARTGEQHAISAHR